MNTHDYLNKWGFTHRKNGAWFANPTGIDVVVFTIDGNVTHVNIEGFDLPNCNSLPILFSVLYAYGVINER